MSVENQCMQRLGYPDQDQTTPQFVKSVCHIIQYQLLWRTNLNLFGLENNNNSNKTVFI